MAISYLAGNRATGTASDRTGLTTYSAKSWVELGRTTLSSGATSVDVTGLDTSDYPFLMILGHADANGSGVDLTFRCGASSLDTGNNYGSRRSENGGTDATTSGRPNMIFSDSQTSAEYFTVQNMSNVASQEKLCIGHTILNSASTGSGTAPDRAETINKWANTSSSANAFSFDQGNWKAGSELIILGAKKSGTITDKAGFWQELADVELSSAADSIDSGTFTAKKYLWIEFSGVGSNSSSYPRLRFNNDTGNNFAYRQSADGGGDNTQTSQNHTNTTGNVGAFNHYFNSFVVNKSDKEKLVITQGVDSNTAGAGNAPRRREVVGKWANTSDSITSVQVVDLGSHNFSSARLKVWGSD